MNTHEEKIGIDVSGMIPRLTEEVAAALRQKALTSFEYEVQRQIQEAVAAYIKENIIPHMHEELRKADAEIRASFLAAIKATMIATSEQVVEQAKKKLASYDGEKLVNSIVGTLFSKY